MDNLEDIILDLIDSKREGTYWDFKEEPHEDNASLLHDLICLANCNHEGDRYLILGVTDPAKGCEIKGLTSEQKNRKNQVKLVDFLSNVHFAAENRPEIEVQTLKIDEKEIDVIIIENKRFKPYFLTKDYNKSKKEKIVRANYIYTRIGDKNTSIDKSADYNHIKMMWKEQFGLNLKIEDRFKELLGDYKNWECEFDERRSAYHKIHPEFTIEISKPEERGMEPFCAFYLDNSGFYGKVFFKHNSTVIFECEYAYCDGCRVLFPSPSFMYIFKDKDTHGFYCYNLEEFDGLFASILLKNSFNFDTRTSGFPFIIFEDHNDLTVFSNYLKNNFNIIGDMETDELLNLNDPNEYRRMINLETLEKIKRFYEENWII
ncbi:ATP-binding protein [Methanobacterium sp.]|uniref:ATP-binding protein n=1 Tax=Methanobacterium sp. TaxID=2164 RepID=UPI0025E75862|nr:ATP-binding protein [Methanobacterium sp.]MBI5459007.1 ATP-binding protein [Methanobacterium sp.]